MNDRKADLGENSYLQYSSLLFNLYRYTNTTNFYLRCQLRYLKYRPVHSCQKLLCPFYIHNLQKYYISFFNHSLFCNLSNSNLMSLSSASKLDSVLSTAAGELPSENMEEELEATEPRCRASMILITCGRGLRETWSEILQERLDSLPLLGLFFLGTDSLWQAECAP